MIRQKKREPSTKRKLSQSSNAHGVAISDIHIVTNESANFKRKVESLWQKSF